MTIPGRAWLTAGLLGIAGGFLFWPFGDLFFDGRARSLILPQLVVLAIIAGLAYRFGQAWPRRWMGPVVAVASFYLAWLAAYLLFNALFPGTE